MSTVEKRKIIFDEKNVPESVYILLSGIARITCRDRQGPAQNVDHGGAGNDLRVPAAGEGNQR
jgi:hypothetical protein